MPTKPKTDKLPPMTAEEAASIRRELAQLKKTADAQVSLNQSIADIDDEQRKQIAELGRKVDELMSRIDDDSGNSQSLTASLEHAMTGLRRDVAAVQVSDIRIEQLSKQCEAAESRADLSLLAASVLGIVAIVLARVL